MTDALELVGRLEALPETYLGEHGDWVSNDRAMKNIMREAAQALRALQKRDADLESQRNIWVAAHTRQTQETCRQEARALAVEAALAEAVAEREALREDAERWRAGQAR